MQLVGLGVSQASTYLGRRFERLLNASRVGEDTGGGGGGVGGAGSKGEERCRDREPPGEGWGKHNGECAQASAPPLTVTPSPWAHTTPATNQPTL